MLKEAAALPAKRQAEAHGGGSVQVRDNGSGAPAQALEVPGDLRTGGGLRLVLEAVNYPRRRSLF